MVRLLVGLAAWAAGTAIAVSVAWLGANVVVKNAGVGSGLPVINAAVLPPPTAPSVLVTPPAGAGPAATGPSATGPSATAGPAVSTSATGKSRSGAGSSSTAAASPSATAPASATAKPSASKSPAASTVHAYALTGGTVTLDEAGGSVRLLTAVPGTGYSVQTWSGTGWLRVDFSSGAQVSSLIASWYQHAPAITVTN